MFLSIIIPVFNSSAFLRECLDSCLKQDIDKSDYEIICVDDCSTDDSFEIVKQYEKDYSNVKGLRLEKNSGPSAARNAGLDVAQGDYCFFVDSDDLISENCLNLLKENTIDVDVLSVGRYVFKRDKDGVTKGEFVGIRKGYVTGRVFSKSIVANVRFLTNVAYGEDEMFMFEIYEKANGVKELAQPLYKYRIHENSAMFLTPEKRLKRIDSVLNTAAYLIENFAPYSQETVDFINNRINIAFSEIAKIKRQKRKEFFQNIKDRGLYKRKLNEKTVVGRKRDYLREKINNYMINLRWVIKNTFKFK